VKRSQWSARVPALTALVGSTMVALAIIVANGRDHGPATARAAATVKPIGRALTIAWGGDTTLGSSNGLPPQHGWPQLASIARVLRAADLTAVNNEGTFATGNSSKCIGSVGGACFAFRAPPANARSLHRAGVDVANLANNHAFDYGAAGMGQTVSALHRVGIQVTGRPGEISVRTIAGVRVAFVGFSTYRWTSSLADLRGVGSLIRRARARAGVVVSFVHAGAEGIGHEATPVGNEQYLGEDRGDVRAFAHTAIDAGADLVLGSGPHVLRGMELYRHRLIAYSLGNLAGFHNFATSGTLSLSGILRVTVSRQGKFLTARFTSLALDRAGIPHLDPSRRAAALVNRVGRADFGARAAIVHGDGIIGSRPSK
jgi:poly-gamma-glutamate capsule biosynthesis protein CapA/YwtB (metallophosphatase superfamily)